MNRIDIPEAQDADQSDEQTPSYHTTVFEAPIGHLQDTADEIAALKLALSE